MSVIQTFLRAFPASLRRRSGESAGLDKAETVIAHAPDGADLRNQSVRLHRQHVISALLIIGIFFALLFSLFSAAFRERPTIWFTGPGCVHDARAPLVDSMEDQAR